MTPQIPETIRLESTSGRKWSLTSVRPLSPSVQLTRTADSTYALKTLTLRSDDQISAAIAEAKVWRRAFAANSTNIIELHDVAVDAPHVYYIMEYCPGSDLSGIRNERSALRCLASLAAGLEVVLSHSEQPAHANLSATHVLLDASGTPKLGGWGLTRSRRLSNPKRRLTERDDVRALAAILYEMLYGRRFDVDNLKLPDTPLVSRLTADLLRNVLYVKLKDVPELTVFRYDIAAARLLVPACTSALEPILNRRGEEILDIDLDSKRGLEGTQQVTAQPENRPEVQEESHSIVDEKHEDAVAAVQERRIRQEQTRGESTAPMGVDLSSDKGIDDAVRQITKGDMEAINIDEVDYLVDSCTQTEGLPDKVFKVLFRLPISKNPIVAFKAIAVVHRLIAEGSASLTALAITNDGFLNWIESSWSRDRMQNKTGKVHMYSYCFSAGEVSWYTAILRKRIEIHGRFAQIFSTHWVPRPDGLPGIRATRRDVFRLILDLTEKSSSILRKIVSAKDPTAVVKHSAVPIIIGEIWKAYHAICWLYATAEDSMQLHLHPELELAHSAIKSAIEAVRSAPSIAANCSPHALLELLPTVPREFDAGVLIKALKKRKKKRKKKVGPSNSNDGDNNPLRPDRHHEELEERGEESSHREGRDEESSKKSTRHEPKQKRQKDLKKTREKATVKQEKAPTKQEKRRELDSNVAWQEKAEENGIHSPAEAEGPSTRPSMELNGLQKLSLSVRRGLSKGHHEKTNEPSVSRNSSEEDAIPGTSEVRSKSFSKRGPRKARQKPRSSDDDEPSSDTDSDSNVPAKKPTGSTRQVKEPKKKRRPRPKKKEESETDSDSDEDRPARSKSSVQKKKKKKKPAKREDSSESVSSSEEAVEKDSRRTRKKIPRSKHVDEKSIPFDKEHPTGRGAARKKGDTEDYTGGSKEALAAAARGKKTPSMNPKFEVAPYEVNFGPQIGSGGFGVVYKAKFRDETVAVKKIHSHALSNAASVAEFQSEVAVLCTLSHPNILGFVGACTKPPNLMIITEFMARGTLFDLLHQSNTRVTWPMRKKVALDTCKGMRYLHDSKLLHRDLKSSNLMLDKDFNCKVGDFGLTRISKGSAAIQMTGQCGTFQYMAVEVLANKPYSEKADVFSFGILLWEMVARKLPYFGMQPMQVGIAVLQQGLRPTIPPKCPEPLAKLMRTCWDSDPNRRPSFAQLIHALESMPE